MEHKITGNLKGSYRRDLASSGRGVRGKRLWAELLIDEGEGWSNLFVVSLDGDSRIYTGLAAAVRAYDNNEHRSCAEPYPADTPPQRGER
jgi:hypothetical protein